MNFKIQSIWLLLIITISVNNISAQEVFLDSKLQKDTIILGEQIELNIKAKISKNDKILFPDFKDTLRDKVEILLSFDPQINIDANYNIINKKLLITSFDTGSYIIPKLLIGLIHDNDTSYFETKSLKLNVKPYILLDTIPVDTTYASKFGFVVMGKGGFDDEIEKYIPDSIRNTLPADSLASIKQYIRGEILQLFSSELTKNTGLYNQEIIAKIAGASKQKLYIVDKGGILEEFIVPGSLDTLFVEEYQSVKSGQALFTLFRIKDIKEDLYNTPYNFAEFWYYTKKLFAKYWWIFVIGIVLTISLIYFFVFYKKSKKLSIFKVKPKEPAHIIAFNKLERIKNEKIWAKGLLKEYHVQITDVLREYIENRFGIYAKEMTSSEIISSFNNTNYITNEDVNSLQFILSIADSVKFAKYQPIQSENDLSLRKSFDFVENTKEVIDEKLKHSEAEIELDDNMSLDTEKK